MTRQFKRFLLLVGGIPLIITVLSCVNYLVICSLLRIDRDPVEKIRSQAVPVSKPLVLVGSDDVIEYARDLVRQMVGNDSAIRVPSIHSLLIEDSWVRRANPYPPLLADVAERELYRSSFFSFGYIGKNGRYCQITFLSGEADTLPSFLVRKVRGEMTQGGDYFLNYAFVLSREPSLIDANGLPTYPQIDAIDWGSFRGGSYNGFEEIFGNVLATLTELFIIGLVTVLVLARKRRRICWVLRN